MAATNCLRSFRAFYTHQMSERHNWVSPIPSMASLRRKWPAEMTEDWVTTQTTLPWQPAQELGHRLQ